MSMARLVRIPAAVAQLVERVLGKDEVMGSNPISSFKQFMQFMQFMEFMQFMQSAPVFPAPFLGPRQTPCYFVQKSIQLSLRSTGKSARDIRSTSTVLHIKHKPVRAISDRAQSVLTTSRF